MKDLTLILIVIITLGSMFATSLLLDLEIVQQQTIRQIIIYILIAVELIFGYAVFKFKK